MKNLIVVTVIVAIGLCVFFGFRNVGDNSTFGSIDNYDAYNATTTSFNWSGFAQGVQLKTSSGVLGSIVLGNATAVGTITLYDATTTVNGAVYGTTTLAVINTGATPNTYTYDVAFSRGLLAVSSATLATSTITWK